MNEPNKTADPVSPPPGRPSAWWKVRPMLQVFLVLEASAIVALLKTDAVAVTIVRAWFRPLDLISMITIEQVHGVITGLAIISLIAVVVEAARRGRLTPRRSEGGMKVASMQA